MHIRDNGKYSFNWIIFFFTTGNVNFDWIIFFLLDVMMGTMVVIFSRLSSSLIIVVNTVHGTSRETSISSSIKSYFFFEHSVSSLALEYSSM